MNYFRLLRNLPRNVKRLLLREPGWIIPNLLVTYHCTQRCLQCSIPLKACQEMVITPKQVELICDKLLAHGTQGISISGGDPLAHPHLLDILKQVSDRRFAFTHLLTNLYGNSKLIDELIPVLISHRIHLTTSFDGFDDIADKIRGGTDVSRRVQDAMEKITIENAKARRPVQTRATVVISQLNLHQINEIISYLERINWEISVDIYRYSSIQHLDSDEMHIRDLDQLNVVLDRCLQSKNVITPAFLIKGYVNYLKNDYPKRCPYLDAPTLGSKFFIQPNGDVLVCQGGSVGNLFKQTPREIIRSDVWARRLADFKTCEGCWNPCYTTFTGIAPLAEMAKGLQRVTKTR